VDNDAGYSDADDVDGDIVIVERQTPYESDDADLVLIDSGDGVEDAGDPLRRRSRAAVEQRQLVVADGVDLGPLGDAADGLQLGQIAERRLQRLAQRWMAAAVRGTQAT